MLSREPSQVGQWADAIGDALREQAETLESILTVLREERARAFAERCPEAGEAVEGEQEDER